MSTTVVNVQPESEPPNKDLNLTDSTEQIEELTEDVATVADEILVEVKECKTQLAEVMRDLVSLRESGAEQTSQYRELLTESRNLREENRNLQAELKALLESVPHSQSSTLSTSQPAPEVETVVGPPINPESVEDVSLVATTSQKKRKRYRI